MTDFEQEKHLYRPFFEMEEEKEPQQGEEFPDFVVRHALILANWGSNRDVKSKNKEGDQTQPPSPFSAAPQDSCTTTTLYHKTCFSIGKSPHNDSDGASASVADGTSASGNEGLPNDVGAFLISCVGSNPQDQVYHFCISAEGDLDSKLFGIACELRYESERSCYETTNEDLPTLYLLLLTKETGISAAHAIISEFANGVPYPQFTVSLQMPGNEGEASVALPASLEQYINVILSIPLVPDSFGVRVHVPLPSAITKGGGTNRSSLSDKDTLNRAVQMSASVYSGCCSNLPTLQYSFQWVFERLTPEQVAVVLGALLTEKPVFVIGQTSVEIVAVCENFQAMLYPLKWQLPYVPVVPSSSLEQLLEIPVPFFFGATLDSLTKPLIRTCSENMKIRWNNNNDDSNYSTCYRRGQMGLSQENLVAYDDNKMHRLMASQGRGKQQNTFEDNGYLIVNLVDGEIIRGDVQTWLKNLAYRIGKYSRGLHREDSTSNSCIHTFDKLQNVPLHRYVGDEWRSRDDSHLPHLDKNCPPLVYWGRIPLPLFLELVQNVRASFYHRSICSRTALMLEWDNLRYRHPPRIVSLSNINICSAAEISWSTTLDRELQYIFLHFLSKCIQDYRHFTCFIGESARLSVRAFAKYRRRQMVSLLSPGTEDNASFWDFCISTKEIECFFSDLGESQLLDLFLQKHRRFVQTYYLEKLPPEAFPKDQLIYKKPCHFFELQENSSHFSRGLWQKLADSGFRNSSSGFQQQSKETEDDLPGLAPIFGKNIDSIQICCISKDLFVPNAMQSLHDKDSFSAYSLLVSHFATIGKSVRSFCSPTPPQNNVSSRQRSSAPKALAIRSIRQIGQAIAEVPARRMTKVYSFRSPIIVLVKPEQAYGTTLSVGLEANRVNIRICASKRAIESKESQNVETVMFPFRLATYRHHLCDHAYSAADLAKSLKVDMLFHKVCDRKDISVTQSNRFSEKTSASQKFSLRRDLSPTFVLDQNGVQNHTYTFCVGDFFRDKLKGVAQETLPLFRAFFHMIFSPSEELMNEQASEDFQIMMSNDLSRKKLERASSLRRKLSFSRSRSLSTYCSGEEDGAASVKSHTSPLRNKVMRNEVLKAADSEAALSAEEGELRRHHSSAHAATAIPRQSSHGVYRNNNETTNTAVTSALCKSFADMLWELKKHLEYPEVRLAFGRLLQKQVLLSRGTSFGKRKNCFVATSKDDACRQWDFSELPLAIHLDCDLQNADAKLYLWAPAMAALVQVCRWILKLSAESEDYISAAVILQVAPSLACYMESKIVEHALKGESLISKDMLRKKSDILMKLPWSYILCYTDSQRDFQKGRLCQRLPWYSNYEKEENDGNTCLVAVKDCLFGEPLWFEPGFWSLFLHWSNATRVTRAASDWNDDIINRSGRPGKDYQNTLWFGEEGMAALVPRIQEFLEDHVVSLAKNAVDLGTPKGIVYDWASTICPNNDEVNPSMDIIPPFSMNAAVQEIVTVASNFSSRQLKCSSYSEVNSLYVHYIRACKTCCRPLLPVCYFKRDRVQALRSSIAYVVEAHAPTITIDHFSNDHRHRRSISSASSTLSCDDSDDEITMERLRVSSSLDELPFVEEKCVTSSSEDTNLNPSRPLPLKERAFWLPPADVLQMVQNGGHVASGKSHGKETKLVLSSDTLQGHNTGSKIECLSAVSFLATHKEGASSLRGEWLSIVATGATDGQVILWDLVTERPILRQHIDRGPIASVQVFALQEIDFISVSRLGSIHIWRFSHEQMYHPISGETKRPFRSFQQSSPAKPYLVNSLTVFETPQFASSLPSPLWKDFLFSRSRSKQNPGQLMQRMFRRKKQPKGSDEVICSSMEATPQSVGRDVGQYYIIVVATASGKIVCWWSDSRCTLEFYLPSETGATAQCLHFIHYPFWNLVAGDRAGNMYAFDPLRLKEESSRVPALTDLSRVLTYEWRAHTRAIISSKSVCLQQMCRSDPNSSTREALYTCSLDGTLKIWQLCATPSAGVHSIGTFDAQEPIWSSLLLFPDTRDHEAVVAVVGCEDGSIRAWTFDLEASIREYDDNNFSEEVQCKTRRLSQVGGGESAFGKILARHPASVVSLASDGVATVASGSSDGEIRLTDVSPLIDRKSKEACNSLLVWKDFVQEGMEVPIDTHVRSISGLQILDDCLISTSWDGNLKVWYGFQPTNSF